MNLSYGGIVFSLASVPDYQVTAVMTPDNADFLYYNVKAKCTAWLNSGATRINDAPNMPGWSENPNGNDSPPSNLRSWNALFERLATPRQQLIVYEPFAPQDDGTTTPLTILSQPYPGCDCDANVGPRVTVFGARFDQGVNSVILEMQFETDVHPLDPSVTSLSQGAQQNVWPNGWYGGESAGQVAASQAILPGVNAAGANMQNNARNPANAQLQNNGGNFANIAKLTNRFPPAMLSNRWSFRVQHDQTNHSAIHLISGRVVFRLDVLRSRGLTADEIRPFFMHPIPIGFQRDPPEFEPSSDGSAFDYLIQDRELLLNFPAGQYYGATEIEVVEHREIKVTGGIISTLTGGIL